MPEAIKQALPELLHVGIRHDFGGLRFDGGVGCGEPCLKEAEGLEANGVVA